MKKQLLSFLVTLPFFAFGQQCSCDQKFQFIKHEIETNYAGYNDKVNPGTKKEYDKLTRECLAKVKKTKNDAYCQWAIQDWLKFFKDNHVQLFGSQPNMADTNVINERIKKTEIIGITPEKLKQLEHSSDPLEGIYYYFDSSYRIVIIRNENEYRDYAGVLISAKNNFWKEGQVKMELKKINDSLFKTILYMRDHSIMPVMYSFNGVSLDGAGKWYKAGKHERTVANEAMAGFKSVQAKNLDDSTLYIQIGTFSISNANAIADVFKANEEKLKTTPNFILDLRGNGGGGDASYQPILPWIYTNPVIDDGNDVYATMDNIRRWEHMLNTPGLPESSKTDIKNSITIMQQSPGKFVSFASDDTTIMNKVEPYPKKIVILINKDCGSSTEQFLLAARQSTKVTLMGDHTSGTLDYSNILLAESPCSDIGFGYSSTRSHRVDKGKGIDNKGIKPDIQLPDNSDWIEVARKYLEK